MISDATSKPEGSEFIYYRKDKIIPRYIDRVAKEYHTRTSNMDYDLLYLGHKQKLYTFSLIDKKSQELSTCTVERELGFLDSSSFKFMPHRERAEKISKRAFDLKQILLLLIEKTKK